MYKMKYKILDPVDKVDRQPSSNGGQDQPLPQSDLSRIFIQRLKNESSSTSPNVSSMNVKPSGACSREKRPRKRTLICGVSYRKNKRYKPKGSINDVKSMRDLLMCKFDYPAEWIRILTGNY